MGGGLRWEDYERDFVRGAENVAEACLANKVRRLLYTSSTAALYLGAAGSADESAGTDPKPHLRGMYSRGKIFAERILMNLHRSRGLPVVILRPAVVVGKGGRLAPLGAGLWVSPTCLVGPGRGRNPLPLVLVEDVAKAMFLAKDAPQIEGKIFNLAGDVRPTAIEYMNWISERSLRNFRFYPRSLIRIQTFSVFKWLVKKVVRKLDNPWPSYHELKSGTKKTQLDCSVAKRYLGWQPTSNQEDFIRLAIECHLKPIPAGDLRVA
jgi:nucleoside-diphosphate-sugar epimerase